MAQNRRLVVKALKQARTLTYQDLPKEPESLEWGPVIPIMRELVDMATTSEPADEGLMIALGLALDSEMGVPAGVPMLLPFSRGSLQTLEPIFRSLKDIPTLDVPSYLETGVPRPRRANPSDMGGSAEVRGLSTDPDVERQFRQHVQQKGWARPDGHEAVRSGMERQGLNLKGAYEEDEEDLERLTSQLLHDYLDNLMARLAVVAWMLSEPDPTAPALVALEQLTAEETGQSARHLEAFLGSVQAYIGNPSSSLDQFDEQFIRVELGKIRLEHSKEEGADPIDIQRSISKIVERLLRCEIVGDHARALLKGFNPDPPEIVKEIMHSLSKVVQSVAEQLSDLELSPLERGAVLQTVSDDALNAAEVFDKDESLPAKMRERYALKLADQAAVGTSVGVAAGLGLLAATLGKIGAPDLMWVELLRAMPNLVQVYTRPSPSQKD